MTQRLSKLDPGHWITLISLLVQAVAIMAVVVWRVGAVEARIETIDARLWELTRRGSTVADLPCPTDATHVRLSTLEAAP